jgi:GNAT superfamily N-acetyltransferase
MIFETLNESAERGELMLVDGGLCHWHLRRDGQLTIREIIVLPERRGQGVGAALLARLRATEGASSLFAKCPAELPANGWYSRMGFECEGTETTRSGRELNLWRLRL